MTLPQYDRRLRGEPHGPLPHPSTIPLIPMHYTAEIVTHDGWWFRYQVRRLHGIGIPERCHTYHRTLRGAQRAAERWRNHGRPDPTVVEARR